MPKRKAPGELFAHVSVCLPPADLKYLDDLASERGLSRGKAISEVIRELREGREKRRK